MVVSTQLPKLWLVFSHKTSCGMMCMKLVKRILRDGDVKMLLKIFWYIFLKNFGSQNKSRKVKINNLQMNITKARVFK